MSAAIESNETESNEGRRIIMRPDVHSTTDREVKRRKRFDSALDRFVTPEERDEIRAFQAKHGADRYPPKFHKELETVDAKRRAKGAARNNPPAQMKSSAPIKASGADIYTARMFSADLAKEFTAKIAQLPAEVQVAALELFERKFLEYLRK